MMRVLALVAVALLARAGGAAEEEYPFARPYEISGEYRAGDRFMGIRLLGALSLAPDRLHGFSFVELSGLAWDDDDGVLYALSDRGRLFHLRPTFTDGILTGARLVDAVALRERSGRRVHGRRSDAEGITIQNGRNGITGDARLVVSFEVVPRIVAFRPDGRFLERLPLPSRLRDIAGYASPNKALEAVTLHPRLGLLTGPEWPLRGDDPTMVRLFGLGGESLRFSRLAAPKSALVALEALPDGSLLTLDRSFDGLFSPVVIALRRIPVPADAPAGTPLQPRLVARFDSSEGFNLDNFEGLTRHRGNRFLIISDDNQNFFQNTLLLYFAIDALPPAD